MTAPEISVVCSTYNRAGRLARLVEALEAQTLDKTRFEVVLVDDGSPDATAQTLRDLAAATSLQMRLVLLDRNVGRSAARNAGWRDARAELIAFTDDDCAPAPGWLEAGLAAMQDPAVGIVVGPTVPDPAQSGNAGVFSRTQSTNERSATLYMHLCNIFYRRADLEAVDGIDAAFNAKGGEDTDLGWRMLDRGLQIAFAPDALVLHDVTKGSFGIALREALSWRDIPRVTKRHPHRTRPLLVHRVFWKRSHEYVLLAGTSFVVAVALRNVVPVVGVLPWLYLRVKKSPMARGKVERFKYLPHAFVIDAAEVTTMVRGSVKNRTFVL